MGRIALENLVYNWPQGLQFIRDSKTSRWGSGYAKNDLSVDQPVDRATIIKMIVGDSG